MKTITKYLVQNDRQTTTDEITNILNEDGAVHLKIPHLSNAFLQTNTELQHYLSEYPNCEGVFFGYNTKRFGGVFAKSQASQSLAIDPTILRVMENLLLPNCDSIQINLTQAISILPGEKEQLPHRDDEMFPIEQKGRNLMVNAIWALSDFTYDNGGTRIWPGSHREDLTREPSTSDMAAAEMKAGEVLLYLGSVLHHGGANQTSLPRNGLVVSYSLGWLRQSENQYLVYPPEVARKFPEKLQQLVGYQAHRPNLGWVEGQDPSILLRRSADKAMLPTKDLLPPDIEKMVREMAA